MYYFISGGLGGLGIELMNWMNLHGTYNFILTGRSGRKNRHARVIKNLENKGCKIVIAKIDITNQKGVENYISDNDFDIDGVFHLAGAIKDNLIKNLTKSDLDDV